MASVGGPGVWGVVLGGRLVEQGGRPLTVSRRKGNPGLADELFSRIVRSRGRCAFPLCDSLGPFDTAHIIGRSYSATRVEEDNAWCMCRTHHALVDNWPDEKMALIETTIGVPRYQELRKMAHGFAGSKVPSAVFWADEVVRLKARCVELGIDTRRRIPA